MRLVISVVRFVQCLQISNVHTESLKLGWSIYMCVYVYPLYWLE